MPVPLAAGVLVVSRFILTKGLKKAVKKFGQKAVDRTRKSKTFKNMLENPPMTTGQKVVFGGGLAAGGVGTAGVGAGFYTARQMQKFNKLQQERKDAESKSSKDKKIKVELLEDKQTKPARKYKNPRSPQNKKREFDTYTRD
tara:strand:- start:159 stop:584 length:426 start_codon:yes stop_codon:yes gene_type:complete